MSDGRKRGPEGTLQRRVFLACTHASWRSSGLAEALGSEGTVVDYALRALMRRKKIVQHKVVVKRMLMHPATNQLVLTRRVWAFYSANGKHPPNDLRGTRAASHTPRAKGHWINMARAKYGPKWIPKLPPVAALGSWGVQPVNGGDDGSEA